MYDHQHASSLVHAGRALHQAHGRRRTFCRGVWCAGLQVIRPAPCISRESRRIRYDDSNSDRGCPIFCEWLRALRRATPERREEPHELNRRRTCGHTEPVDRISPETPGARTHARTHARTTHRTTAPTLCRASQIGPKIGSHFSSSSTGAGSLPLAAPPLSQHASETKPGRVRPWLGVCNRSRVRRRGGCRRGRAVAVEVSASRRTYKWRTVRSRSRQGHWAIASTVCAGGNVCRARRPHRTPNVLLPDRRVTQARL